MWRGGAVITSDPALSDRMEQLCADERRYVAQPRIGHLDLEEVGAVRGRNYCLSEFHAALLPDGLDRLDEENEARSNVRRLEQLPVRCEGARLQGAPDQHDGRTFYHLYPHIDLDAFSGVDIDHVAAALS